MSGHSKWSTIKHKKGAADQKRGQAFTKLSREIIVASRSGGSDTDMNFRLRLAVENARAQNMPKENIERAIAKGAGTGADGGQLEEVVYEGYGPGGAGIIIQTLTDNKNRTASDVRSRLAKGGGNMAASNAVAWNFEKKGQISVTVTEGEPDEIALQAVDVGADDVDVQGSHITVTAPFHGFEQVRQKVAQINGVQVDQAEVAMISKTTVPLDQSKSMQMLRLLDALEDLDDVQKVYSNADFPDSALAEYARAS
ncbi:MAG: YebC/PmpR family DNA-binding transcriptional regulator [Dehalococcoidia bacterium]|nr:YebC/PmpR family DNA-binding transcriptional regulator [Dehalococcoidia bacterium]MSQ34870.1 YebC/PmpR family DNA-binding transcriptional regulator [Dehalococcoidia bacterium]